MDVERVFAVAGWIVAARLLFGSLMFLLGRGAFHPELGVSIVFWDAADGLLALAAVVAGLEIAGDSETTLDTLRGPAFALLGAFVIVMSARRAAMVAVLAAVVALFIFSMLGWSSRRSARLDLVAACSVLLLAAFGPGLEGLNTAERFLSSFTFGGDSGTSAVHYADIRDGMGAVVRSPVLGYGYYTSPERFVSLLMTSESSTSALGGYHNLLINLWVRNGLLGVVALIGAIVNALSGVRTSIAIGSRGRQCRILAAFLVGMLVAGVTGSLLWGMRMPWYFWSALTAIVILSGGEGSAQSGHEDVRGGVAL